jgi:hypothetical protein
LEGEAIKMNYQIIKELGSNKTNFDYQRGYENKQVDRRPLKIGSELERELRVLFNLKRIGGSIYR